MQRLFLILLLLCSAVLGLHADGVKFSPGKTYQIRSVQWPEACITPLAGNEKALTLSFTASNDSWWRIERIADDTYTIRNASTGRYFTYSGNAPTCCATCV